MVESTHQASVVEIDFLESCGEVQQMMSAIFVDFGIRLPKMCEMLLISLEDSRGKRVGQGVLEA